jgi:replicative DNA helicase
LKEAIPSVPQSVEAEEYILGGVLLENSALDMVTETISPEDFYSERNRIIYAEMLNLRDKGLPIDYVSLSESVSMKGKLDSIGGVSYITKLTDRIPTTANIEYYAKLLKDKSLLRSLILGANSIIKIARDPIEDVSEALQEAEQIIFNINKGINVGKSGLVKIKPLVAETYHTLTRIASGEVSGSGIDPGFIDLNNILLGFHPSDLIIIAGRPSMGKTSLAMNIASYVACEEKLPVAIFSLEMSKEQLVLRLLASEARVDQTKVRNAHLTREEWSSLIESADRLSNAFLYIDDTPGISIGEIRSKLRRMAASEGLRLLVIDYLQLMSSRRGDSREQEIADISRSLKAIAKEFNVPVIALSQLNRSPETREGNRPKMGDLRESGAIEQDADVVCLIYREDYYKSDTEEKGITEIIIGKNRNGPTDTIKLKWFPQYTRFGDYTERV